MLPDLPMLKREISEVLNHYVRMQTNRQIGEVFGYKHIMHEGDRSRILRADGSVDNIEMRSASAEMTILSKEVPTLTIEQRKQQLDEMADKLAEQMSKQLFGKLRGRLES